METFGRGKVLQRGITACELLEDSIADSSPFWRACGVGESYNTGGLPAQMRGQTSSRAVAAPLIERRMFARSQRRKGGTKLTLRGEFSS